MATVGIYKIQSLRDPNKIYIGSSVNLLERERIHYQTLYRNKHDNIKLQNHCNKYGISDLVFEVIEEFDFISKEHLLEREQFYIDTLNPWFNILKYAHSVLGYRHTKEDRKKMSDIKIGIKWPHTKEWDEKIGKALKGKPKSPEHIANWMKSMTWTITPEHAEILRTCSIGLKRSEETLQRQRESMLPYIDFLRKNSEEHKRTLPRQTVELIRDDSMMKEQTKETDFDIADRYGISVDTVRNIRYNRTYKY